MYKYLFCSCILWITVNSKAIPKNKILLISFDGFRFDYIDRYQPPSFMNLISSGVHAPSGMYPVFPTKTFPNHYSLVTGLYPESHGVVDNNMYDPVFNETFVLNVDTDTKWFDQAEPLWITAKLQGLATGAFYWPGASTKLQGIYADCYEEFNISVQFKERVDKTIECFVHHKASFITLYFEEPDSIGHKFGVFSDRVKQMVEIVDDTLGYLVERLKKENLFNNMNIIIISDHGMINTSRVISENLILSNVLNPDDYFTIPQTGPVASIMPAKDKLDIVYNKLKSANPHVKVYKKNDLPERLHYRNNRRIMPIIAVADEKYQIMMTEEEFNNSSLGQHGWDNALESMKPIFLAAGPNFKTGVTIQPFQNFYIYPLMCQILGVSPQPNNGSLEIFKDVTMMDGSASIAFKLSSTSKLIAVMMIMVNCVARRYIL